MTAASNAGGDASDGHPTDAHMARRFLALRDMNERLVLAVIEAQGIADASSRASDEAARAAELDALTGLPARTLMLDRFAQAAAAAHRHGTHLAVLFIDLDNFKQVNDTLGHAAGDDVLRTAATALVGAVRTGDTVSRHGGDEFVLLLPDLASPGDVLPIAEKVMAALGVPSPHGDCVVRLTCSIGISLFPDDGEDPRELIAMADAAMYRAKRLHPGGFAFHQAAGEAPAPLPVRMPVLRVDAATAEHEWRTAQLREANEQLVLAALSAQAMQAHAEATRLRQSEFMAMLAHELRNPLAPMRTVSMLLGASRSEDVNLPRLQAIIERQVTHMSRMVDDLLDLTRISTGKLRLNVERLDLSDVLTDAMAACRPAMDLRLQQFTALLPAEPLWLSADRTRLTQVVTNLLDNASKYTPHGGAIALSCTVTPASVVVLVTDTGSGIEPDVLPRIFDLFSQDPHAAAAGSGLGIGLTVVRELVTAHGGTVTARNRVPAPGSEFEVTLPRIVPAAGGPTP
ncbi:MAG: diguanylate cyclase [Gemmatimonadaceae bacterium]|nr:diguanylate cyclase [Gemmatimonadaceae bacterium]